MQEVFADGIDFEVQAYDEGFQAFLLGQTFAACPYSDALAEVWKCGWEDSEAENNF